MKQVDVITSHNISIDYEAATLVNRGVALFIDLMIQFFYYIITILILASLKIDVYSNDLESFIIIFISLLPVMFYSLLLHFILKGQTIGKLAVGIRVVKLNGQNAKIGDYTLLWTFRLVDFWFSLGAIGALFISTTEKAQRLGDILAETAVIRNKPEQMYAISDILSIKDRSKHTPTYLAVTKFTDEDMILIKNAISRVKKFPNKAHKDFIRQLANKAATELKLETVPEKKLTFLKTLLQDYIVLTR